MYIDNPEKVLDVI